MDSNQRQSKQTKINASSGALIVYEKQILLIQRDNNPGIKHPGLWGIPGGVVEPGESHNQALERELIEEIAIVPKNIIRLGILDVNDGVTHMIYAAKINNEQKKSIRLGNEGSGYDFYYADDLDKLDIVPDLKKIFYTNPAKFREFLLDSLSSNIAASDLGLVAINDSKLKASFN